MANAKEVTYTSPAYELPSDETIIECLNEILRQVPENGMDSHDIIYSVVYNSTGIESDGDETPECIDFLEEVQQRVCDILYDMDGTDLDCVVPEGYDRAVIRLDEEYGMVYVDLEVE